MPNDEEITRFMHETRPLGEWAMPGQYVDDPVKSVLHDHLLAVRWANNMLGLTGLQDSHAPLLETLAETVLRARLSEPRQV